MPREVLPTIPGLNVLRRLGRGGMGDVYLAADASHQTVALKLATTSTFADPFIRARFEREIAAASSIRHENVVHLLGAGEIDGVPYALFDRVRGRSLDRVEPQPWSVVVPLGRQLARAIAAVHAAGWLHRDVKRSNVMIGDHGLVTLLDFGLAKRWSDRETPAHAQHAANPDLTAKGTIVGTPRYLAPETRRGRASTPATDVFGLGLVLHEVLGGTVDSEGRLTRTPVGLPDAFSSLLARTLTADPRKRPTIASIVATLERLPASTRSFGPWARDDAPTWPFDADGRPTDGDVDTALRRAG